MAPEDLSVSPAQERHEFKKTFVDSKQTEIRQDLDSQSVQSNTLFYRVFITHLLLLVLGVRPRKGRQPMRSDRPGHLL